MENHQGLRESRYERMKTRKEVEGGMEGGKEKEGRKKEKERKKGLKVSGPGYVEGKGVKEKREKK